MIKNCSLLEFFPALPLLDTTNSGPAMGMFHHFPTPLLPGHIPKLTPYSYNVVSVLEAVVMHGLVVPLSLHL